LIAFAAIYPVKRGSGVVTIKEEVVAVRSCAETVPTPPPTPYENAEQAE